MEAVINGFLTHGPWAAFTVLVFIVYSRLVNDVLSVTRKNAEAISANTKTIEQAVGVMVEVKDAIHKCRKE